MRLGAFILLGFLPIFSNLAKANSIELVPNGMGSLENPVEKCKSRIAGARIHCETSRAETYMQRCAQSAEAPLRCAVNECMKAKGFPLGLETNPADYCLTGIPYGSAKKDWDRRRTDPRVEDEFDIVAPPVARSESRTPPTPPIPGARPAQPESPRAGEERQKPEQTSQNWAQESSQDIQQCSNLQSQANVCCTQPERCQSDLTQGQKQSYQDLAQQARTRQDQKGLEEVCRQYRDLSVSNGNVSTGYANICMDKHGSCTQTCEAALTKWRERLNGCGAGCDRPLVSDTVDALAQKENQCRGYASLADRIRSQSYAATDDAYMSQVCQQKLNPYAQKESSQEAEAQQGDQKESDMSLAGLPSLDSSSRKSEEASSDSQISICDQNPNGPGCFNSNAANDLGSLSGLSSPEMGGETNSFNVGARDNFNQTFNDSDLSGLESSPSPVSASGHQIPNGGGGVPSGGSPNGAANVSSAGEDLPAMLGSGVNPNVLHGEKGGGGDSAPQSSKPQGSGFEFQNRYSSLTTSPSSGTPNGYQGMDLKRYLPGGAQDPSRKLAGVSAFHPDIGPEHIDFFQRITNRMQTLCKLKQLLGCQ